MFENAQYIKDTSGNINIIKVDINGTTSFVPTSTDNGDYTAIMRLVESGELVIADDPTTTPETPIVSDVNTVPIDTTSSNTTPEVTDVNTSSS